MPALFWWLIFLIGYPAFSVVTSIILWNIEYKNWPKTYWSAGRDEVSGQAIAAIIGTALFPLFAWLAFVTMTLLRIPERRDAINVAVERELAKRWEDVRRRTERLERELHIKY